MQDGIEVAELLAMLERPDAVDPSALDSDIDAVQATPRAGVWRKAVAAITAAIAVLLAVGGVAWLSQQRQDEVADEPSTTVVDQPTTTVADQPPTTVLESAEQITTTLPQASEQTTATVTPPSPSAAEVSTLPAVETAHGTMSWTRIAGSTSEIPPAHAILATADGAFVAVDFPHVYASPDGITWTADTIALTTEGEVALPLPAWIEEWLADWPLSMLDGGVGLYRQSGTWQQIEGVAGEHAVIEGLRSSGPVYGYLTTTDAVVIAEITSRATVPWDEVYATSPDALSLWPDPESLRLEIFIGDEGAEQKTVAAVIVSIDPLEIVFTDVSSGDVVHRVFGDNPGVTEAQIIAGIANPFSTTLVTDSSWWVSGDGGASFSRMATPWDAAADVEMTQELDGYIYATVSMGSDGWLGSLELWRTRDGHTWESVGQPEFAPDADVEGHISVDVRGEVLRAEVMVFNGRTELTTVWESEDGATWTRLGEAPSHGNLRATDFGWVTAGSDENVYVSSDFATWDVLLTVPDVEAAFTEGGGGSSAKAVGDAIFSSAHDDTHERRVLWVARLNA